MTWFSAVMDNITKEIYLVPMNYFLVGVFFLVVAFFAALTFLTVPLAADAVLFFAFFTVFLRFF